MGKKSLTERIKELFTGTTSLTNAILGIKTAYPTTEQEQNITRIANDEEHQNLEYYLDKYRDNTSEMERRKETLITYSTDLLKFYLPVLVGGAGLDYLREEGESSATPFLIAIGGVQALLLANKYLKFRKSVKQAAHSLAQLNTYLQEHYPNGQHEKFKEAISLKDKSYTHGQLSTELTNVQLALDKAKSLEYDLLKTKVYAQETRRIAEHNSGLLKKYEEREKQEEEWKGF